VSLSATPDHAEPSPPSRELASPGGLRPSRREHVRPRIRRDDHPQCCGPGSPPPATPMDGPELRFSTERSMLTGHGAGDPVAAVLTAGRAPPREAVSGRAPHHPDRFARARRASRVFAPLESKTVHEHVVRPNRADPKATGCTDSRARSIPPQNALARSLPFTDRRYPRAARQPIGTRSMIVTWSRRVRKPGEELRDGRGCVASRR